MWEIVYIAASLRLPIVMNAPNRALSAPINIWNDHSDSMAERDGGWIQLYCENSQEAYDTSIMAYRIAENSNVSLPVMVCVDGFTLSHLWEPAQFEDDKEVEKFAGKFVSRFALDSSSPKTFGALAFPKDFMTFKKQQDDAMASSLSVIKAVNSEFSKKFGRSYGDGLIETYRMDGAKKAIIGMGSLCSTSRIAVDMLRSKGEKIGLIKIKSFRPFPLEELRKTAKNLEGIAVIDRAISLGSFGPLYLDVKTALPNLKINDFILALGGKDISEDIISGIAGKIGQEKEIEWIF